MLDGAEILFDSPLAPRGRSMLNAMLEAAPGAVVTNNYIGRHKLLMMHGVGRPDRMAAFRQHKARGGHIVLWDLGYWQREEAMRLSVNGLHPTPTQLALAPTGEWRAHWHLRSDGDPSGPVLLIGLGDKSASMYGLQPMQWERATLARIKSTYPGRRVLWRPKGKTLMPLAGTTLCHGVTIEQALAGCSLMVCRHSNVGVDACIAGVPVQCEGGAALALYANGSSPSIDERMEFIRRVGFWNWRPKEATQAWAWINKVIG